MSAAPIDENIAKGGDIVAALKNGGMTATLIGAAGMVAKILLSEEKVPWPKALCHIAGAGIVAFLVGQVLETTTMSSGLKMAALGVSGAAATQIIDFVLKWVKAKGDAEVAKVTVRKKRGLRGKKR